MLDLRFIRENHETVRRAMRAKMLADDLPKLDQLLNADEEHRLVKRDLEEKQATRNADSTSKATTQANEPVQTRLRTVCSRPAM